jgi:hypothetical protein
MPNGEEEYTLWNRPMENWTNILEGVEVTNEMEQAVQQAAMAIDRDQIEDRLKPFQTTVTEKTMSQLIG